MKTSKYWTLTVVVLGFLTQSLFADEFVSMGEYLSRGTVKGGERGYYAGNNQDMVFINSKGEIIWSSKGGWVSGNRGQVSSAEAARIRSEMRAEKAQKDREVREGRRNVEYGEYISRGTTFHGYAGHWSGNNQDALFVSSEYGTIYSTRGGWVNGFGPEFDTASRAKWGAGISDDAQIYTGISDPNTLARASSLTADQLYVVVEANRRFVTVAYSVGGRTVLSNQAITDGAIIPGKMLGKTGQDAKRRYQFKMEGNGYRFNPIIE
ncbi:MAG: hypothetical protein KDD51_05975 [Bdellovibrionales bacterium]|nr:hypothetical protein [Bdellovibrionales bacterium]